MTTSNPMSTFVYPITDNMQTRFSDLIANDEFILCLEDFDRYSEMIVITEPRAYVLHKASNKWLEDVTFSRRFGENRQQMNPERKRDPMKLVGFTGPRTFVMLRHRFTRQNPPNSCTITAYTCQLSETSNVIHVMRSATIFERENYHYPHGYVIQTIHDHGAEGSFYMMLVLNRATHLYKVNAEHSEAQEVVRIDNDRYRFAYALKEKVLLVQYDDFNRIGLRTYDPSQESVSERFHVQLPRKGWTGELTFEDNLIVFYGTAVDVFHIQSPEVQTSILYFERMWLENYSGITSMRFVLSSGEIILTLYHDSYDSINDRQKRVSEVCAWNLLAPPRLAELVLRATHRHMPTATAQKLHPSRIRNVSLLIDFLLTPTTSAHV